VSTFLFRVADISLAVEQANKIAGPRSQDVSLPISSWQTLPRPASVPSSPPPAFMTWVPDGSLRFINPDFLSSAEKQTLEQQVQVQIKAKPMKRKESDPLTSSEDQGEQLPNEGEVKGNGDEERPKKIGRPIVAKNDVSLGPPPLAISFPRGRPTIQSSLQRRHSRPSSGYIPNQTNETDLLRQVKSNNLNMPIATFTPSLPTHTTRGPISNSDRYMNWIPSGNHPQDRAQYDHIHNQHRRPPHRQEYRHHQHQPQHRVAPLQQNKQNDLFTYKPLYHPPDPAFYMPRPGLKSKNSTSSTDIHSRDREFSPITNPAPTRSPCVSDSPPLTKLPWNGAGPLAMSLPHGDWRRKYVGRGRGQSGG